jgi:TPR repeat protein
VVREVVAGGPAADAGILPDDVVTAIGGRAIANDCDLDEAAFSRACDPVDVSFRRAGVTIERRFVPAEQRAFYDKACGAGVVSACFRQAWDLWRRSGGRGPDSDHALELYQKACLAGSADACADEGHHLMDRPDRANDTIAVLELSCDLGSGAGCAHFAFLYATGSGKIAPKDDKRAAALYAKACDLGDAKGCYNAGIMAEEGRGVARDLARAIARYEEACAGGSSTGCTNLGFHYEHGRGVKKDPARALELYQRGCDGTACQPSNLAGCLNVGRANRDGIGTAKNAPRAAEVFRNACERTPNPEDVGGE